MAKKVFVNGMELLIPGWFGIPGVPIFGPESEAVLFDTPAEVLGFFKVEATAFCGYCGRREFDCTCPDAEKTPRMDDLELARFTLDEESPTLGPPPIPKPGPPPKQPPRTETEVLARVQKMACYFCGASAEQRLASSKQLICRRCLDTLFID